MLPSIRFTTLTAILFALCAQAHAATITLTTTIRIADGATYDGQGNTYTSFGLAVDESSLPLFRLGLGSTVKNAVISMREAGPSGVNYYGNGTITNVTWSTVGDFGATIKSPGNCTISNSSGSSAVDRFCQCNAAATWTLSSVRETTCQKIIRQNGGTTYTCKFYYNGVTSDRCSGGIGRTDSATTRFYYRALTVTNFTGTSGWWYGRSSQASIY